MPSNHYKTALKLCKFYTKPDVAKLLVDLIGDIKISSIADMCSGKGSLSLAAINKWKITELITLDIDTSCIEEVRKVSTTYPLKHTHINIDMLAIDSHQILKSQSELISKGVDLTLCNPPYLYGIATKDLQSIINASDLGNQPTVSPDIAFIAQCLSITKNGGTIGLILSDSLISSTKYNYFRNHLTVNHNVFHVIQLPRNSFIGTEALAYLVLLNKNQGPTRQIILSEYDGLQIKSQFVSNETEKLTRWDFSFHELKENSGTFSLSEIGAKISRGNLTSKDAKSNKHIFHIDNFPNKIGASISLPKQQHDLIQHTVFLQEGDIAIARIGRNLHEKIAYISAGYAPITDCVYKITIPKKYREVALAALTSTAGIKAIRAHARGVGALSLSKKNLMHLRLPLQEKI